MKTSIDTYNVAKVVLVGGSNLTQVKRRLKKLECRENTSDFFNNIATILGKSKRLIGI